MPLKPTQNKTSMEAYWTACREKSRLLALITNELEEEKDFLQDLVLFHERIQSLNRRIRNASVEWKTFSSKLALITKLYFEKEEIEQEIETEQKKVQIQELSIQLRAKLEDENLFESVTILFSIHSMLPLSEKAYQDFCSSVSSSCTDEFAKASFDFDRATLFAPFLGCLNAEARKFCSKILFNLLLDRFYSISCNETTPLQAICSGLAFVNDAIQKFGQLEGISTQFSEVAWNDLLDKINEFIQFAGEKTPENSIDADKLVVSFHRMIFLIREGTWQVPKLLEECYLKAEKSWFRISMLSSFASEHLEEHEIKSTLVDDVSFIWNRSIERISQLENEIQKREFFAFFCHCVQEDLVKGHFERKMQKIPLGATSDLASHRKTFLIHLNNLQLLKEILPSDDEALKSLKQSMETTREKVLDTFFNFCHRESTTIITMDSITKAHNFYFAPETKEFTEYEFATFFQRQFQQRIIVPCETLMVPENFIYLLLKSAMLFSDTFVKWAFQKQKLHYSQLAAVFVEGEAKRIRSFFLTFLPFSSGVSDIFERPIQILQILSSEDPDQVENCIFTDSEILEISKMRLK